MVRARKKKWTCNDYAKFLNLPKKNKRMKTPKGSQGGVIIPDLLLAKMISKENRNRAQRDAIIDTMNTGQMNGIRCMVKAFLKTPYKLNPKENKYADEESRVCQGYNRWPHPSKNKKENH